MLPVSGSFSLLHSTIQICSLSLSLSLSIWVTWRSWWDCSSSPYWLCRALWRWCYPMGRITGTNLEIRSRSTPTRSVPSTIPGIDLSSLDQSLVKCIYLDILLNYSYRCWSSRLHLGTWDWILWDLVDEFDVLWCLNYTSFEGNMQSYIYAVAGQRIFQIRVHGEVI